MEEDIKTIEHIIDEYKKLDILHSAKTPCSEIIALENLIARYKEIKDVFIENSTSGEDVKYLAKKYNEVVKAIKQLDNQINNK